MDCADPHRHHVPRSGPCVCRLEAGGRSAHRLGRVTFNPLKHVDPFGTILLPALLFLTKAPFLFGWAKPVPVAFQRLGKPRRDMALVAIAVPLTNVVARCGVSRSHPSCRVAARGHGPVVCTDPLSVDPANLILAIFNMFPIPPLDGSRVVMSLLPKALAWQYAKLERFGFLILLGIIFLLPMLGRMMGTDLNLFRWAVAAFRSNGSCRSFGPSLGHRCSGRRHYPKAALGLTWPPR